MESLVGSPCRISKKAENTELLFGAQTKHFPQPKVHLAGACEYPNTHSAPQTLEKNRVQSLSKSLVPVLMLYMKMSPIGSNQLHSPAQALAPSLSVR